MKFMKENTATSGRGASEIPCEAYSISNSFRCKFIQLAEFQIRRSNTVRFLLLYIFDGRVPCHVIMNLSLPIFFRHYFQRRRSSLSLSLSLNTFLFFFLRFFCISPRFKISLHSRFLFRRSMIVVDLWQANVTSNGKRYQRATCF